MLRLRSLAPLLALFGLTALAQGQSNQIPGTNVKLAKMDEIKSLGHLGSFPTGINGFALSTTACNKGTVNVPWEAPMKENHAMISFVVARESGGRFEQISDYSYVKHGFFALTSSYCDTCTQGPFGGGDFLGIGCSDTYAVSNNGDMFYLAPPDEIDPWLGTWDANCSWFDAGTGPAPAPQDCDGVRSLTLSQTAALGPVGTRINVLDSDLNVPNADFFFQGYYTIRGEPEATRGDNIGSRQFQPNWNGSKWNLPAAGGSGLGDFVNGPIVERWSGALVTSVTNGGDDGRVYAAVKVTGPVNGLYHYEYVLQNRDNNRGIDRFSLPICPDARVLNAGFGDVDQDAANDWSFAKGTNEISWTGTGNALRWNSLYNFWFDSDAAPTLANASLDQADPGAGLATLSVQTRAPGALYNVYLGAGCGSGTPPSLYATGSPAQATLGNPTFGLESSGNEPGQVHFLYISQVNGLVDLGGGCTQYLGGLLGTQITQVGTTVSNGAGVASFSMPVPSSPAVEGMTVNFQGLGVSSVGGPVLGQFELTNGLRVRVGNALPSCP